MISGLTGYGHNKNLFVLNSKKADLKPQNSDISFKGSDEAQKEIDDYRMAIREAAKCRACTYTKKSQPFDRINYKDERKEAGCMKKCTSKANIPGMVRQLQLEEVEKFIDYLADGKIDCAISEIVQNSGFESRFKKAGMEKSFAKVKELDPEKKEEFVQKIKEMDFKAAGRIIGEEDYPDKKQNFSVRATTSGFKGDVRTIVIRALNNASVTLRETNLYPLINGRLCARDCKDGCIKEEAEKPNIQIIEKYLGDHFSAARLRSPETGKKVAVIGAGPAGLAVAGYLSMQGHDVQLIDAASQIGGILRSHIPQFRLEPKVLTRLEKYADDFGIKFEKNKRVGGENADISIDSLLNDHDRVVICTGASIPNKLPAKLKNLNGTEVKSLAGMYNSNEYLIRAKEGKLAVPGKKIIVIGGGNVAMDVARTSIRDMGASQVDIVYRRTRTDMPARKDEIEATEKDGVGFKYMLNPVEIYEEKNEKENKIVKKIVFQRMRTTGEVKDGKQVIEAIPDSLPITEEADVIVTALGSRVDEKFLRDMLNKPEDFKITVNEETGETNIPRVSAAGDVTGQSATAITAMASGLRAARFIDEELAAEA